MVPFAVVGSDRNVVIEGKQVRGRKNRWGVINVEDERHCEFVYLRNFLLRCYWFIILLTQDYSPFLGLTCRISSRPLLKFITRLSDQNNSWHSRTPRPGTRNNPLHENSLFVLTNDYCCTYWMSSILLPSIFLPTSPYSSKLEGRKTLYTRL